MPVIATETKCKVCDKPFTAMIDPDCEDHWKRVFLSCSTCNRCFDAREKSNRLQYATEKIAARLNAARVAFNTGSRSGPETETWRKESEEASKDLQAVTKKYTRVLAEFYMTTPTWSMEMVDILMETPWKADKIMRAYRVSLGKQRNMPTWSN